VVCAQQPHARRGQVTVYQHSKAQRGTGGERGGGGGGGWWGDDGLTDRERESTWVMTTPTLFDVVAKTGRRKFSKF